MGRLSNASKNRTTKAKKRPDIPDKEHLIQYLEANSETELPFVEEVWEKAVDKAKENEGKQPPMEESVITDKDGNVTKTKKPRGAFITDPVKYYFKLMGLNQNKKKAIAIQEQKYEESEIKQAIAEIYFDDEDEGNKNVYTDEISSWIALFPPDERQYLKRRYTNYYDTYEINEGADKLSLKRLLSLEIELYRIDKKRAAGKSINLVDEEKLTKQLNTVLESLKWTKKQRSNMDDMAQNKFTIFMDSMMKNGKFTPTNKKYDEDDVDFLMKTYVNAIRDMLS